MRFERRLKHVKPLLERYWDLLGNISATGGSNFGKAVNYSLNNKKELEAFLLDSRLELTNNRAERAVKPFVMGRNNWLFSDTNKGADASIMWYSVIESAKLNNLNAYGYLLHLLTELPQLGEIPTDEQLDSFMPWLSCLISANNLHPLLSTVEGDWFMAWGGLADILYKYCKVLLE